MTEQPKGPVIHGPKPIDVDLNDPIIRNDIEFTPERIKYLEGNQSKCFLCKWILQDYREHGTLKGYWSKDNQFEVFPVRGEIDHLWLEWYKKPYPWNAPLSEAEKGPSTFDQQDRLVPVEPSVTPAPRPVKPEPPGQLSGMTNPNPHSVPLSKPKNAKRMRL
jgi:hypothetical protein